MLTEHFSLEELGGVNAPSGIQSNLALTASGLESFRALIGAPCNVHDGYRDATHNTEVGGSPTSDHVNGLAADVDFSGCSMWEVWKRLFDAEINGTLPDFDQIIWYPLTTGHIHFGFGMRRRREQLVKLLDGTDSHVVPKLIARFPGAPK